MSNPNSLERLDKEFSVEEILFWIGLPEKTMTVDYAVINISSDRLKTFRNKGVNCLSPGCPLKGQYFCAERSPRSKGNPTSKGQDQSKWGKYHLNLYSKENGVETLFTCDHIVARSLGGKDIQTNMQTMCTHCNTQKSLLESRIKNKGMDYFSIFLKQPKQEIPVWLL